jgi:hypothetical protein
MVHRPPQNELYFDHVLFAITVLFSQVYSISRKWDLLRGGKTEIDRRNTSGRLRDEPRLMSPTTIHAIPPTRTTTKCSSRLGYNGLPNLRGVPSNFLVHDNDCSTSHMQINDSIQPGPTTLFGRGWRRRVQIRACTDHPWSAHLRFAGCNLSRAQGLSESLVSNFKSQVTLLFAVRSGYCDLAHPANRATR